MSRLFLGIDTSNYTTSVAVIDEDLNIIHDERIILQVEKGSKGLRQQEALFQHLKNLPILFERLNIDIKNIQVVGISTRPRNVIGSYMPTFLVGEGFGRSIGAINNIKLKRFSHQEGHIGGILIKEDVSGSFYAFHLSGGTTEALRCINNRDNLLIEMVGGSLDISFGQLIDRIGVKLGLSFPCGAEMEKLAIKGEDLRLNIDVRIKDGYFNISGLENKFIDLIDKGDLKEEDILYTLFVTLGKLILKLIESFFLKGDEKFIITGGVASNGIIRNLLIDSAYKDNIIFGDEGLSVDNAVGIAYIAMMKEGWEE